MEEYAELLRYGIYLGIVDVYNNERSKGHNPYLIPLGGSNQLGLWGYIEAFRELMEQVYYLYTSI